jgi:hypothetical protein
LLFARELRTSQYAISTNWFLGNSSETLRLSQPALSSNEHQRKNRIANNQEVAL